MYKCSRCGYVHWMSDLPEECPFCHAEQEALLSLDDASCRKIENSLSENEVLVNVLSKLNEISYELENIFEEDHSIIFDTLFKNTVEMTQMIKAELEKKVKEGRWG
ncbi:MAG TPA: hypothetical protein ENH70_09165 [Desulfobacteraceae bacterium]|nr:hypothetical protein [Desulfobacteraceae bacterium]